MKHPSLTLESRLEAYLHEHIPLSSAMEIKVLKASSSQVILHAPLAPNINHKKTAFGGSLHAMATLACWSLLHVNLNDLDVQLVVAKSEVEYLAPVTKDFNVECLKPAATDWDYFLKVLKKRSKARLELQARIYEDTRLCLHYSGIFVAMVE